MFYRLVFLFILLCCCSWGNISLSMQSDDLGDLDQFLLSADNRVDNSAASGAEKQPTQKYTMVRDRFWSWAKRLLKPKPVVYCDLGVLSDCISVERTIRREVTQAYVPSYG